MECKINIKMNNAAFTDDGLYHYELANILRKLAVKVQELGVNEISIDDIPLLDSNGNRVGMLVIEP